MCLQVSCNRHGHVVNITLASPDELTSQYPHLRLKAELPSSAPAAAEAGQQLNDPSLWEAVSAVQRAWPQWHYRTQALVLQRLPCGQHWLRLGLQGLHLDNVK